ncbi:hypothetical protein ACFL1X_12345, partial [Candidatus Hydrogenedentota bacterium]
MFQLLEGVIALDDCPTWPIPESDFYGPVLHPEQVARNPVFIVDGHQEAPDAQVIRRTLENALPMNRPYQIDRANFEARQKAIDSGPPGHDGWKNTFAPWEGRFAMGSEALRSWANRIEAMEEPTYNFEMVHGIDTTCGVMMRNRARQTVAWLHWAESRTSGRAKKHLAVARRKFTDLARVGITDLGIVRTVPCLLDEPTPNSTLSDLTAMLDTRPALLYLLADNEKELLGERVAESRGSP